MEHGYRKKFAKDYFWFLISCYLCEFNSWDKVENVIKLIKIQWPLSLGLSRAYRRELTEALLSLRDAAEKATMLRSVSNCWYKTNSEHPSWKQIRLFPFATKFVIESWRLFIDKDPDFIPTHPKLQPCTKND